MKRLCDILFSLFLLILLSPLFIILLLLVKIDTKNTPIFSHRRIGRYGKHFYCLKFRTMKPHSMGFSHKVKNDSRITRLGRFLRKTSLDELPQLFNVLRGDMSFIGWRPIVSEELYYYGHKIQDVISIRPGITGLWQVCGKNTLTYEERVTLDSIYARHGGIMLDIGILLQTIRILLQPSNY